MTFRALLTKDARVLLRQMGPGLLGVAVVGARDEALMVHLDPDGPAGMCRPGIPAPWPGCVEDSQEVAPHGLPLERERLRQIAPRSGGR